MKRLGTVLFFCIGIGAMEHENSAPGSSRPRVVGLDKFLGRYPNSYIFEDNRVPRLSYLVGQKMCLLAANMDGQSLDELKKKTSRIKKFHAENEENKASGMIDAWRLIKQRASLPFEFHPASSRIRNLTLLHCVDTPNQSRLLIDQLGVPIDMPPENAPLRAAIKQENHKKAKALLSYAKANPYRLDKKGLNCFHVALKYQNISFHWHLLECFEADIMLAVALRNPEELKKVLDWLKVEPSKGTYYLNAIYSCLDEIDFKKTCKRLVKIYKVMRPVLRAHKNLLQPGEKTLPPNVFDEIFPSFFFGDVIDCYYSAECSAGIYKSLFPPYTGTLLTRAFKCENANLVKRLLKLKKTDLFGLDSKDKSCLYVAARLGNVRDCKKILRFVRKKIENDSISKKLEKDLVNERVNALLKEYINGMPLHINKKGVIEVVPNRMRPGKRPIIAAGRSHSNAAILPLLSLFCEHGADLNVVQLRNNRNLLHFAAKRKFTTHYNYLLSNNSLTRKAASSSGKNPIDLAISSGRPIEVILEMFYRINDQLPKEARKEVFLKTILSAIADNNVPLVHLLVHIYKKTEKQALFLKFDLAKTDEMRFLFLKLCPVTSDGVFSEWLREKMRYERSPEGYDMRIPVEEVIEFLKKFEKRMLKQEVHLHQRHILPINNLVLNNSSATVMAALLHLALRHQQKEKLVPIIMGSGLLNITYACGVSTLMEAAAFYQDILPGLLKFISKNKKVSDEQLCALLNAQDIEGNTALHYAAYYAQLISVVDLLKAGASPFVINNKGLTPRASVGMPIKSKSNIFKEFFIIIEALRRAESYWNDFAGSGKEK